MPTNSANSRQTCTDPVVGAILSGWRYDISQIPADLRVDYEAHLAECSHCRRKQRLHRTVDVLLMAATTLSFVAFLLAAVVLRRLEAYRHIAAVHLKLHPEESAGLLARLPASVTIGLEAVAIAGVVVSLLLWGLVAMATPMGGMVSAALRQRMRPADAVSSEDRVDRKIDAA
ncbi:hypothetical protein ACFQBQ_04270 [Granulicella cerasi]|uniref:Zinc-finger domain-containing protein n=1 Tax=Granulicella cerasi TaxID=741063 RepID=A0ABW1Z7E1_9BACT|nr:hypothetical protein [Granulicella cerasi]